MCTMLIMHSVCKIYTLKCDSVWLCWVFDCNRIIILLSLSCFHSLYRNEHNSVINQPTQRDASCHIFFNPIRFCNLNFNKGYLNCHFLLNALNNYSFKQYQMCSKSMKINNLYRFTIKLSIWLFMDFSVRTNQFNNCIFCVLWLISAPLHIWININTFKEVFFVVLGL